MDFAALFHALLLILSIPNKALNSLNSLLNAYPRTIGSPPPPPVITAIAYRNLPAVSTACSFEAHGTTSPTYTAVTGQLDNVMPTSYNLTNVAPTTSLYTESHESSWLVVYEMPTAGHFEYPTISNNAVRLWLLILIMVYLVVLALRHRCNVYEALQRSVKEQNDGLVKEKLTALATIEKDKLAAINLRIKVQAVFERDDTRQDLPALLLSHMFGKTSRLEVLCENFRAQIKESDLLLSQAGDELNSARSKHAVAETQNSELEKRVVLYEEEATDLRKSEEKKSDASKQAAEIEIGRLQERARVQFDAYALLQAEYTASSQNCAMESMDTATEFEHAVVYDIDDFAQTTVPFSMGGIDDSSKSTIACTPFGPSVTVRLPPPGPPKVEADASAICSSVKSDDDAEVSDQFSGGDAESSSNSGESGYVSGSQQASGSTDTIYHNAPAESEQHETQVDSGGEDSIATLRDPSFAALELRQESVSYSNDTTYDSASAAGEQREVGVYGGGEASIATPRDPSPASVELSLARTDTTAGSERSDLGNECASSDGFAASQVTDTELDVKKKRNRRGHRGGTGRSHETIEEGNARRAARKKPLRRGGHNQRSRGLKSANMW
ncbi:hypothetical protein LTR81_022229 [Elasticomyces elasticus]